MATDREMMDAKFAAYRRRLRRAAFVVEVLAEGASIGDREGRSATEMLIEADNMAQERLDAEDLENGVEVF